MFYFKELNFKKGILENKKIFLFYSYKEIRLFSLFIIKSISGFLYSIINPEL